MRSIFDGLRYAELLDRLDGLTPDAPGRWGRMTAHQAVCHLSDSFAAILGERPLPRRPQSLRRRVMRLVAFTLPVPWPKGVRTSPEVDAEKQGTPPGDFAGDVVRLQALLARFVESDGRTLDPHYVWGDLSRGEWGRYGYRHVDHHLRQFGV